MRVSRTAAALPVLAGIAALLALGGCASIDSQKADPTSPAIGTNANLSSYRSVIVSPFASENEDKVEQTKALAFSRDVMQRLKFDYGRLFDQVYYASGPTNSSTLVLTGNVPRLSKGGKFWSGFHADVSVLDASNGAVIQQYKIRKESPGNFLSAIFGRDVEDLMAQAAAGLAKSIALAKGWDSSEAR